MKPIQFQSQNSVFTKPKNSELECGSLPTLSVGITTPGDNPKTIPLIISCWELDETDIENILRDKRVWLTAYGVQPPVSLESSTPELVEQQIDYDKSKQN